MLFPAFQLFATVHEVRILGNTFSPNNITIEAGDTVRWLNTGGGFHNVEANGGSFRCSDSCEITPNDGNGGASSTWISLEVTFNYIGSFDYFCEIHLASGMTGVINVVRPTSGTVYEVHSSGITFTPNDITIAPGDIVNFINDSGLHNVRANNDDFECSDGCLGVGTNLSSEPSFQNWSFFIKFDNLGDNPYFCEQHVASNMTGIVRVAEDLIYINGFE